MPSKKKRLYRVVYNGIVLEGSATNPNNAMRQAFRTLIKQGRISKQPPSDNDGGFKDTICQLLTRLNPFPPSQP